MSRLFLVLTACLALTVSALAVEPVTTTSETFYEKPVAETPSNPTAPDAGNPDTPHETKAQGHHEPPSTWARIVESNVFNLIIVLAILAWVLKKVDVGGAFQRSHASLTEAMATAEERRKEAETARKAAEKRMKNLAKETEAILEEAKTNAQRLADEIVAQAKADAETMVATTTKRLAVEETTARQWVERRLLETVVADAQSKLASDMSQAEQRRSVEAFIKELSLGKQQTLEGINA